MLTRFKEVRKALKLSQAAFGEAIGLARNTVSLTETGDLPISEKTIANICKVFNVSEKWFRTGEGEMFRPQSYEDEVAQLAAVTLRDAPDSFRARVVHLLVTSTDEELEILDKMLQKMIKAED